MCVKLYSGTGIFLQFNDLLFVDISSIAGDVWCAVVLEFGGGAF
jgi:hypothetical protein